MSIINLSFLMIIIIIIILDCKKKLKIIIITFISNPYDPNYRQYENNKNTLFTNRKNKAAYLTGFRSETLQHTE